jgi:hypothetical protein
MAVRVDALFLIFIFYKGESFCLVKCVVMWFDGQIPLFQRNMLHLSLRASHSEVLVAAKLHSIVSQKTVLKTFFTTLDTASFCIVCVL